MERTAASLFILGLLSSSQGEYARACALFEESVATYRATGNKRGIAHSLSQLAQVLFVSQADQARVSPLLEECLALSQEVGFKEGIAAYHCISGQLALARRDLVAARSLAEKSVALYRELGHRHGTANSLALLGGVLAAKGELALAFRKFAHNANSARKQAAKANLASAATQASDGKPRAQGRVRRRSRTCACCPQIPEPRFPAASSGSRSSLFSGLFLTIEFPKGITAKAAPTGTAESVTE